jgi:hypothetical protein
MVKATTDKWVKVSDYCIRWAEWTISKNGQTFVAYLRKRAMWVGSDPNQARKWVREACQTSDELSGRSTFYAELTDPMPGPPPGLRLQNSESSKPEK